MKSYARDDADDRLEGFLRERLALPALTLRRLPVACISRIYRAEAAEGRPLFVKWGMVADGAAADFAAACADEPLVPQNLFGSPFAFEGRPVFCQDWRAFERVKIADMTDARFRSFLDGYRRIFGRMQRFDRAAPAGTGEAWQEEIRAVAARHTAVRTLLRGLLELGPEDLRRPSDARLAVVHGDFHSGNFGFDGERLSTVLDFDNFVRAYPIEDLAFAFAESARQSALDWHPLRRARLRRRLRIAAAEWGRPADEWRFAFNLVRLVQAAKSLRRRPDSLRTALIVAARDRRMRGLIKVTEGR